MIVAAAWLVACGGAPPPPVVPEDWTLTEVERGRGLSGLGRDRAGRLWAVSERVPELVQLDGEGRLELVGVPKGHDTEALTWIGADRIALGTESPDGGRRADPVLLATVSGGQAVVDGQIDLPLSVLGVPGAPNRGLEAVCVSGDRLVAVSELVVEEGGARWAPFATRPLSGGDWTAGRLALTSDTGKIAGLDCDGTQAFAIERHFGVARLLRWQVPDAGGDVTAEVAVAVDLLVGGGLPNIEGVAVTADAIWLVTDNDYGGVTGPSWLFRLPRP